MYLIFYNILMFEMIDDVILHISPRPRFVGYRNYEIVFSESSWKIIHVKTQESVAVYNESKLWPTGEHDWIIEANLCGPSAQSRRLLLTR